MIPSLYRRTASSNFLYFGTTKCIRIMSKVTVMKINNSHLYQMFLLKDS